VGVLREEVEKEEQETLYDRYRTRRPIKNNLDPILKEELAREKKYHKRCPEWEDYICKPSIEHREELFPCSGIWFQTCHVYLFLNKGGHPSELIES